MGKTILTPKQSQFLEFVSKDEQTDKRTTHHEFTLSNLTPDTLYYFEVMSQSENYVYDANREFRTPF